MTTDVAALTNTTQRHPAKPDTAQQEAERIEVHGMKSVMHRWCAPAVTVGAVGDARRRHRRRGNA
jgi:hypothetical protein